MERAYRAADVRSAEEPLLEAGEPLMERASYAVANRAVQFIRSKGMRVPGSTVLAIAGHGNNGGDALHAAAYLARRGMSVTAVYHDSAHEAGLEAARSARVRLHDLASADDPDALLRKLAFDAGIWIDGMLGIGASGGAREPYSHWIEVLSHERQVSPDEPFVIAVDIPSGLGVDSATVPGPVLRADATVAMGCAKPAHLLPPARHYCGEVEVVELGLFAHLPSEPAVIELSDADVADTWDIPSIDDHKYTRGVVGMMTGSSTYPGAAVLGVGGALATGPGMVRYLGNSEGVLRRYPEVVSADGQVQAWVIGSGLDDDAGASRFLQRALEDEVPVVLDAGAIALLGDFDVPSTVVITPHEGELTALLNARGESISRDQVHAAPARAARLAATLTGATVLLKGATDVVAAPAGPLYAQGGAPAWRATAGTGDVLAGILGGLLAGYGDELKELGAGHGVPARLAAAATHIHASAATIASGAGESIGAPISASDIVDALPAVIYGILNPKDDE